MTRRAHYRIGQLHRLLLHVNQRQLITAFREREVCFQKPRCIRVSDNAERGVLECQSSALGNQACMSKSHPILKKNDIEVLMLKLLEDRYRLSHPGGVESGS